MIKSRSRRDAAVITLRKKGEADRDADVQKKEDVVSDPDILQEEEPEKTIRCRFCDHDITRPSLAVEPHEHTFRNPAGLSFHILCYSDAPGALNNGVPTLEHTWFSGYAWSYAICQNCQSHLGWWFTGIDTFAGLIATRLIR
ncbi:hypothetical protein GC174_18470 [bacterium]|nr:hypothetical protein [bacterium]